MKLKSKNKGHLMIDVLFSIILIGLIASVILPNIIILLGNQKHLKEREELINTVNSCAEEIIGNLYHTGEIKFSEQENKNIVLDINNTRSNNLNHIVIVGKRRDINEEVKIEFYLWDKGLFTY